MNVRLFSIVAGVAGLALLFAPTSVQAAKGQKKNPNPETEHRVHGEVVSVHHEKGKEEATITIRTHNKKKNAVAGQAKKSHEHTFTVSAKTQVFIDHGKHKTHSNVGHLKAGEHVSLLAHGKHADVVDIHEGGKKTTAAIQKINVPTLNQIKNLITKKIK
jgi:hypothetical protein